MCRIRNSSSRRALSRQQCRRCSSGRPPMPLRPLPRRSRAVPGRQYGLPLPYRLRLRGQCSPRSGWCVVIPSVGACIFSACSKCAPTGARLTTLSSLGPCDFSGCFVHAGSWREALPAASAHPCDACSATATAADASIQRRAEAARSAARQRQGCRDVTAVASHAAC